MITFVVLLCTALAVNGASLGKKWDGRIVGGQAAEIEDYPYQVSLQYYNQHNCGGSIISPRIVVTAAHCTDGFSQSAMSVRVGSTYHASGGQLIRVSRVSQHPSYDHGLLYNNDISILELEEDIVFLNSALPIEITQEEPAHGYPAVVTGWGALNEGGSGPVNLQSLTVPIIGRSECRSMYGQNRITENMICAGFVEGGRDSCQGDSGGPLMDPYTGQLVGVVSWGTGCARPERPGVYTNVNNYRSWISGHLRN